MSVQCASCGADNHDIDVRCTACGAALTNTGVHRLLGSVVLGNYVIEDVLGQGGMSVVYKGRHRLTEQEVALKVLPRELAAHAQVKSRFLEEARALAQLDHPNIVHLYNFGAEEGCLVLAMQYVHGKTFERMILDGERLDWRIALTIALDVLRALEYAHGRGIVHRDMKPSNVLVREDDGAAMLMDFGIAKMSSSSKLTATGQTMGTVRYMSPEQVRGQSVDARTDIYSLGVTLYEAIVGDTPFDGDTHFEIMTKHLNEPAPPPSRSGVSMPAGLEDAIMCTLAKAPDDRFQTAAALRAALEAVLAAGDGQRLAVARTVEAPAPAPPRSPVARRPQRPAGAADDRVGIASALEPAVTGEPPPDRRRSGLWLGLAVLVAAATVGVVIVVFRGEDRVAAGSNAGGDASGAGRPTRVERWPEPFVIPGTRFAVDRAFLEDELRVLAVSARDAAEVEAVRAAVVEARTRFIAFVAPHAQVASVPLNLIIVPQRDFCDRRIYEELSAPQDCARARSWYRPDEKTLFVADTDDLLPLALPSEVALQICLHAAPGVRDACADGFERYEQQLARQRPP